MALGRCWCSFPGKHQCFKSDEGDYGKPVVRTPQQGDVGKYEEIENNSGSVAGDKWDTVEDLPGEIAVVRVSRWQWTEQAPGWPPWRQMINIISAVKAQQWLEVLRGNCSWIFITTRLCVFTETNGMWMIAFSPHNVSLSTGICIYRELEGMSAFRIIFCFSLLSYYLSLLFT